MKRGYADASKVFQLIGVIPHENNSDFLNSITSNKLLIEQTSVKNMKISNTERTKQWKAEKLIAGWLALSMIVPPELALQIKELKLQYKMKNLNQYKKF
ncbi:MAG: hypothetical protein WDN00_05635 [Limisphaerales bacterium]